MPRMPQAPPPGIARNATPEATSGRWWDGNNIRWRGGVLQPVGGNVVIPGTQVDGPPRDVLTWHDNSYVRWAAIGTDNKLFVYRFDTQVLTEITPTGVGPLEPPGELLGYGLGDYGADTYGTARDPADVSPADISASLGDKWSMDTWGEDLLFVPTQDGHLYHWSPTTPTTAPDLIANAPIQNRGVIVTDQRQAVLLGAGGDPRMIAWSDQEDYTVWAADVTNLAGQKQLVTQAYAITAVKVTTGILIYTTNDVHMMTYVGPPYAYGIVQVAAGCAPISLRAPVAIGTFVAWPGIQTFWVYNGYIQPLASDVQDWFYSLINRANAGKVFGSPNPAFAELWWDWPDEGATECNRYVAVNYALPSLPYSQVQRSWIIGMRERTAADQTGTMDNPILGGLDPDGTHGDLYIHEFGWTDNGTPRGPNGTVYAESGAIVIGEGDQRYNVTQLVMDAATPNGPGMLGYEFFTREQPYDDAGERSTGLYTEVHAGLMDVRFSGRSVRMRMEALADGPFAVGKPRLVIVPAGKR